MLEHFEVRGGWEGQRLMLDCMVCYHNHVDDTVVGMWQWCPTIAEQIDSAEKHWREKHRPTESARIQGDVAVAMKITESVKEKHEC